MMKFFQSQVDKRQQKLRQEDCEFEISLDCIRRWCLRRTQTTKKKPKYLTSSKVCVLCVCVFLILPVSGTMSEFHGLGGMRGDTGRGEAKTLLAGGQGAGREGRHAIYKISHFPRTPWRFYGLSESEGHIKKGSDTMRSVLSSNYTHKLQTQASRGGVSMFTWGG